MTTFELIRSNVTAEAAARRYGLQFNRYGRRAHCPWCDDGKTGDLAFYGDHCVCMKCHRGGDAVALAAQVLGMSAIDAAKQVNADFALGLNFGKPPPVRVGPSPAEIRQAQKEANNRRWIFLCDVAREAEAELRRTADPAKSWDDPRFVAVLRAKCQADEQLDNFSG